MTISSMIRGCAFLTLSYAFIRAFGYWAVLYTNGISYRTEAQLGGETIADVGGGETTTTGVIIAYADTVREIEEYLRRPDWRRPPRCKLDRCGSGVC